MKRIGFTMKLRPGAAAEYKKRYAEVWPELAEAYRAAGVIGHQIFLDPKTGTLFAVQTLADDKAPAALSADPIVRQWRTFLADIVEANEDDTPKIELLEEIWALE